MLPQFQKWLEQEIDSNRKIIEMLGSVKHEARLDKRFSQALCLASHLAACRNNWLVRMTKTGEEGSWWPECDSVESADSALRSFERPWTEYLEGIEEGTVSNDFEFEVGNGIRYRWNIEGQIMQMIGHGFYHRGQIALLVDQLGGTPVDTDYLYWAFQRNPNWGKVS